MLINTKEVAKILGVGSKTVYDYVEKELIPQHVKKLKPKGCRQFRKFWDESEIMACIPAIEAFRAKPSNYSKQKKNTGRKPPKLENFDMAMGLMGVRR